MLFWEGAGMQDGYFKAAWGDITGQPGWFGRICLLALVLLIPVFGTVVVLGYLFGWARDIAWGVRTPLPWRVFGNEDGRLYSRGFFALVIAFVCSLVPWAVNFVWVAVTGISAVTVGSVVGLHWGGALGGVLSLVFGAVFLVVSVIVVLLCWVGTMRMSVYGTLSAGFQLGKIWAMVRRDPRGLLKIFGMAILLSVAATVIMCVLFFVAVFVAFLGVSALAALGPAIDRTNAFLAVLLIGVFASLFMGGLLVVTLAVSTLVVFGYAMVVRALGYWTQQFDVPAWRGQDDPMPFELGGSAAWRAPGQPGRPEGNGGAR